MIVPVIAYANDGHASVDRLASMKSLMRTIHAGVYAERLRRLTDVFVPLLFSRDRVLDVG